MLSAFVLHETSMAGGARLAQREMELVAISGCALVPWTAGGSNVGVQADGGIYC